MLSYIRRSRTFKNTKDIGHSKELRVVNVLATVLSRGIEIVAVILEQG
jgi:hypothetical protein